MYNTIMDILGYVVGAYICVLFFGAPFAGFLYEWLFGRKK